MAENQEKKEGQVNAVTLSSEKVQLVFALHGEAVYITVKKKGQKPDKLVITAHEWMQINKGMFNPENKTPEELQKEGKKKSRKTKAKKEPAN